MSVEERRAAVLTAAVPLLRERGAAVSTRDLAQAAGVAEGTLFRVFPDKRALMRAALAEALDPSPLEEGLAAVDRTWAFEDRLHRVVELLSERMEGLVQLLTALHDVCGTIAEGPPGGLGAEHEEREARVLRAIASVLEPDAAALRVMPLQAAALVRSAVLGGRLPGLSPAARLAPEEIAVCLGSGLLRPAPGGTHRSVSHGEQ